MQFYAKIRIFRERFAKEMGINYILWGKEYEIK